MVLRRLWAGDLPLEDAFWSWAVLGGLAVNISTSLAFYVLIAIDQLVAAWIVGYVISISYNIVAVVGVWRAAAREPGDRSRAGLYRAVTLIGMTILSLT